MRLRNVSAVILNYNRGTDTIECINSLELAGFSRSNIIVVDNGSWNDSIREIKSHYPDMRVIENNRNLGYAAGMNIGLREVLPSKTDHVLVLNSDVVLGAEAVDLLLEALDKNKIAAVASGTIYYYPKGPRIWYAGGDICMPRASAFSKTKLPQKGQGRAGIPIQVTFVSGCIFLVKKEALRKVGLFDERFFMYLEDTEFCVRLLQSGFQLLYVPKATIYHKVEHHGERALPLYYGVRNRFLFLKVCTSGFSKIIGTLYLYCTVLIKSIWWSFSKPSLVRAVVVAVQDYLQDRFHEGRGITLFGPEIHLQQQHQTRVL